MATHARLLLSLLLLATSAHALDFHVSPTGTAAAADGSKAAPFATLTAARDAIRQLKKAQPLTEGVTVWVHGGTYGKSETLTLEAQDSGTEKTPIVYRAADGEKPLFIGAVKVTGFVSHQGDILKADLKPLNLPKPPLRQLLFKGERQTLARYPNVDHSDPLYGGWAFLGDIPQEKMEGHAWKREAFINDANVRQWAKPEEVEMNIFAGYGWWNFIMPVASLDATNKKLTLAKDCGYDLHPYNRYFFQNALEELDAPGEWYVDRSTQTLYFWPPASLDSGEVRIPTLASFVKLGAGAKHVTLRGLSFTGCVGTAVVLDGAEDCNVAACTIAHAGGWAGSGIRISGLNNKAVGNDISYAGDTGISLGGGDRLTLTPANNVADNNHIHHTGMLQKNGAGVELGGVGNSVTHNHIHHTPRMAVQFSGNNLVIEYNHLHHTVLETQDGGAVYTGGRDWISSRGTSLKYNFIHDTIGVGQGKEGLKHPHFTWGIYMDDNAGGLDIVGNIVARSARASLHLHNGRDHLIENNIFVDGGDGQVEYSGWNAKHPFLKTHLPTMIEGWTKVKDQPAWKLMRNMDFNPADLVRPDGTVMSGNIAKRNIIAWKDATTRYVDMRNASNTYNTFDENLVWNGGKPINTAIVHTGGDVGPELSGFSTLMAATPDGKTPKGWGWNHKPRKDLKLLTEAGGVLRIEAATSADPNNSKVSLHSPAIAITPGSAYRARLKVKGTLPDMRAGFSYGIYSAGNGYWQSTVRNVSLTEEWQEIEVTGAMLPESDPKWKPWMKTFWLRTDISDEKGEMLIKDLTIHAAESLNRWESWQADGWDKHSLVADPLFENWDKDDYRLKKDSPAFKLGFVPIPVEKIGQYESELRVR